MSHLCIACKNLVNSRQEALLCDGCNKWQHRKCNSGVARDVYRNAVQKDKDIPWKCELWNGGNYEYHCFQVNLSL